MRYWKGCGRERKSEPGQLVITCNNKLNLLQYPGYGSVNVMVVDEFNGLGKL